MTFSGLKCLSDLHLGNQKVTLKKLVQMVHFGIATIRFPKGSEELVFVSDFVASLQLVTSLPRFNML